VIGGGKVSAQRIKSKVKSKKAKEEREIYVKSKKAKCKIGKGCPVGSLS
jgi:hypothetical protein